MYDLTSGMEYVVVYLRAGKSPMILSRHRGKKNADRALTKMTTFGQRHDPDFEPENYSVLEIKEFIKHPEKKPGL